MIVIPGRPFGKERPRPGKYGRFYTPAKTKAYENKISLCCLGILSGSKPKIKEGQSCRVVLRGYFKNKATIDLDNLIKSALDGMQGIVFANDRQVKAISAEILEHQDEEKLEIEILDPYVDCEHLNIHFIKQR